MQNVINTPDSPDAISDTSLGQEEEKEDGGWGWESTQQPRTLLD